MYTLHTYHGLRCKVKSKVDDLYRGSLQFDRIASKPQNRSTTLPLFIVKCDVVVQHS